MSQTTERRRIPTPWGVTDDAPTDIGLGILRVDTPSHGGYFVPDDQLHRIPAHRQRYATYWSGGPNWYEEDCAWACVAVAFPELFPADAVEIARTTVANWVDNSPEAAK